MFEKKLKIVKKSLGNCYSSNDELLFKCPKCNHHKKKLSVNLSKDVFKCWICDYRGNSIEPLIRDPSLRAEWRSVNGKVDITRFDNLFSETVVETDVEQSLSLPEYFVSLTGPDRSPAAIMARKYLHNREVTDSDILMYKMGFCFHGRYKDRIIIPSFGEQGNLNYFVARSFRQDSYKYKNPPCSRDIIFNDLLIDWSQPVVLVEGFFDSIKYNNSIPILGSTLNKKSKLFCKIVQKCSSVYICLDKDASKKELKIVKNLLDFGVKVYKIELYNYSDLGEVPTEMLTDLKKRSSIITQEDYLLYKLSSGG